jgi:hypothetical protein
MGAFFLLRMNDHLQYLRRISATLEGDGDFRGSSHQDCALGRWLDDAAVRESAGYGPAAVRLVQELAAPHESFHAASARALDALAAGRAGDCARESTTMHQLSNQLVSQLLAIDAFASGKVGR